MGLCPPEIACAHQGWPVRDPQELQRRSAPWLRALVTLCCLSAVVQEEPCWSDQMPQDCSPPACRSVHAIHAAPRLAWKVNRVVTHHICSLPLDTANFSTQVAWRCRWKAGRLDCRCVRGSVRMAEAAPVGPGTQPSLVGTMALAGEAGRAGLRRGGRPGGTEKSSRWAK